MRGTLVPAGSLCMNKHGGLTKLTIVRFGSDNYDFNEKLRMVMHDIY